ncbi:hypothetical protein PoB_004448900 [Plakobranchus ocellatus]|uniref:Uncharacterized protein n=1 Tax=Plakobranchus ocellatus TaxID=259542 RepID=A0AAV4BI23_9GAST|nr:hypothetical protein PoB_004448900 [Plakobranchus ocellatus]
MDGESAVVNVPDGDSTIVGVPHGDSTIVGVFDGGSVVVTLNLGSVRTRCQPKGQDCTHLPRKGGWQQILLLERVLLLIRVFCVVFVET